MNKLFTKIAALALGAAMAFGVGVAVSSKNVSAAHAADPTATFAATNTTAVQNQEGDITSQVGLSSSIFTATLTKNGAGNAMYIKKNDFRMYGTKQTYKGNYLTISVTSAYTIKSFVFGGTTALTTAQVFKGAVSVSSNQVTGSSVTASSGTYTINSTEFTIYNNNKNVSSNTQVKFGSITITYASASIPTTSVDVSPATVTLAPGETQQLTTTVLPANTTDTLSYSSNANSVATVSSSGLITAHADGTATITATSGSYSDTCVVTVETPTTPFITPEKTSTSGYTGCDETIGFTYGNLTSLGVSTSGATVSASIENDDGESADVVITFNTATANDCYVYLKDGSTTLATITVTSITASSVSITGLAASSTAYVGKTLNLGSSVTVTATGIYTNAVTWESEDDDIATVSDAGVVTGVAEGTVDITVTSDDYPSAAMTCTVTVESAPIADLLRTASTSLNYTASSYGDVSGVTKTGHSDITSEATYAGHFMCATSPNTGAIQLNPSKSSYICTTASSQLLSSIAVTFINANGKGVAFYGSNTAYTASYTAYGSVSGTELGVLTADGSLNVSGDYKYLYIVPTGTTYVGTIEVTWRAAAQLSSVTTSGQTASFTQGGSFAYGGTLTAHYTQGKADATVTPTEYKYGASGFNPASAGTAITIGTTLSVDTHNGKYVSVGYTEGGITKWSALYQITVTYAAVTSVSLSQNSAEIGLNETFDYTQVTVTVSPSNANKDVTWSVSANTVGDDYVFDGSGLSSKDTEGTITLKCESVADSSKYATIVVSVTGDPTAAFDKESTSGYAGKSEVIGFTYGNMDDENKIVVASSNTSYVTVANDLVADEGVGLVTINFVAAGSANVTISYDGGSTLDTLTVSVNADSVVSVSWNASNFDVFSGTTLTSDIDNTWLASYEKASGDEGLLEYGDYTLKLGGSAITLPHTWAVADSGKTLCIEYGGVSSPTVSVTVTQTINAVYASNTETNTVSWTASAAANLGSQISSQGETDTGTISTGTYSWNYTRTLTSLTSGKYDNISFQGSTWIQLGSNNSMESIEFTTSAIPGTIKSVSVVVATAGSHELTIDVGGTKYLEGEGLTVYTGTAGAENPDPTDCVETGTGSSSGAITITIAPTASTKKAMVIRSISVTYETQGSGSVNIANDASHKADQRAAVAFANAFNDLVDEYGLCSINNPSGGTNEGWAAINTAYTSFKNSASDWSKNLIKYASEQYTGNVDNNDCIERMRQTYAILVGRGYNAIMSDLVTIGSPRIISPVNAISNSGTEVAIIVVTSMIGLSAVGGYFFLRKRKENI